MTSVTLRTQEGQVATMTVQHDGVTEHRTYDDAGRLVGIDRRYPPTVVQRHVPTYRLASPAGGTVPTQVESGTK